MQKVKFSYIERDRTLTVSSHTGITLSLYSDKEKRLAKNLLGIENAVSVTQEKEVDEKIWDRFLKMEY